MKNGQLLYTLLDYLKDKYDSKWYHAVLTQFMLGFRASEMLAIQIWDISEDYSNINFRQAKTNKIIYNEPIPKPLQHSLRAYCSKNMHRFIDGYLFYLRGDKRRKTSTYGAFWSKWRKALGKKNPKLLEKYPFEIYFCNKCKKNYDDGSKLEKCPKCKNKLEKKIVYRYRISSHSLRRLHREHIALAVNDPYKASKICHYEDFKAFLVYLNQFKIEDEREQIINNTLNPIGERILMYQKGQIQLNKFI